MTPEQILEKAKNLFSEKPALKEEPKEETKKVELGELLTEDGMTIYFDGELLEGSPIWITVDGENAPVPVGEYMLPDGTVIIVTEAGIAGAVTRPTEETAPIEEVPVEMSEEKIVSLIKEAIKPLEEKITQLSAEKETAEKKVVELETKLSEEPASNGVTASPEGKGGKKIINMQKTNNLGVAKVMEMLYS